MSFCAFRGSRNHSIPFTGLFWVVLVGLVLVAPGIAGALTPTSPSLLPMAEAPGTAEGLPPAAHLEPEAFTGHLGVVHGTVSAADVGLPFGGTYYWNGPYLVIDGWVRNTTTTAVGPIAVGFVVRIGDGTIIAQDTGVAAIYNLIPGRDAAFRGVFELPAYAGQTLNVTVANLAIQPSAYPDALDMTFVSARVEVDGDGVRNYVCTFRNDTSVDVWMPIVGGWELDGNGDLLDSLYGFGKDVTVAPGATFEVTAYGVMSGIDPATVVAYCQAVPTPVSNPTAIYRFYNRRNGAHFYTPSPEERDAVMAQWASVFQFEGIAYYTNPSKNVDPLFRFYYRRGGSHFYTASYEEAKLVVARWPQIFTYEGPTYSVSAAQTASALPVYRFLNRRNSTHFFTASTEERDHVIKTYPATYIYEGPAFWVAQ